MKNRVLTVSELKDRVVEDFDREEFPHTVEFWFSGKYDVDKELDRSLEVWKKWKEQVSFLIPEGYVPEKHKDTGGRFPVYDEEGRFYGVGGLSDAFTSGVCLYKRNENFVNFKENLMIDSYALLDFPPYEWKEKWYSIDVGYSRGWCIWVKNDGLPAFTGKSLLFFNPFKVAKDGVVEIDAVLFPLVYDENIEKREDRIATFEAMLKLYSMLIHEYLMFNRFQLLWRTGRISEEEFFRFYVHTYLCFSLFFIDAPIHIGKRAFQLLASNVLIPANEQLIRDGKAVIELEDWREFGLIREKDNKGDFFDLTRASFPLRVRIWDWERTKVLPLPSRSVVYDEAVLPLPEEVEAFCMDKALQSRREVEEIEEEIKQGKVKKGSGRWNVYEIFKRDLRAYAELLPEWYRELYKEKVSVR